MDQIIIYATNANGMFRAMQLLQGRWKIPALYVLQENGTLRYSQIQQALGVTSVMLNSTLKELEACGLVLRHAYNEIPPRVDYSLSDQGQNVARILIELAEWGSEFPEQNIEKMLMSVKKAKCSNGNKNK